MRNNYYFAKSAIKAQETMETRVPWVFSDFIEKVVLFCE